VSGSGRSSSSAPTADGQITILERSKEVIEMRIVHRQRRSGTGWRRPRPLSSLGAALALLAVLTPGVNAAPGDSPSRRGAAGFCSASKGVAASIVQAASISTIAGTPQGTPSYYERIAAAEPALDSAASGKLAKDLRKVFPVINVLIDDLKQAHWNPAGLAPYEAQLLTDAAKIKPELSALRAYYRNTCKFGV
jgi:hypothetical protein